MTPERKRYAEMRVARLEARIIVNEKHLAVGLRKAHLPPSWREACSRCHQLHNDRQAIKRWKKELAAHAQKRAS